MSQPLSPVERIKAESHYLRGSIPEELAQSTDAFSKDAVQLLKHHGIYQQDDRDARKAARAAGKPGKHYIMMVRTAIPGGIMTADQLLAEIELGDLLGNGTIRLTTRQSIQHHGIPKGDLRELIARIHQARLSTLAACGDVVRNVMCCPAPFKSPIYAEVQQLGQQIARHFLPRTKAYCEIWLQDAESGEKTLVGSVGKTDVGDDRPDDGSHAHAEIEPIYGSSYLPRKFKIGIGFCHDNCIDVYTHDVGLIAVLRDEELIGYNVLVGGGMGVTPSNKATFPALAKRMAFVEPDRVIETVEAVVKVQRDHGNRADRKTARLKYLIHRWGMVKFRGVVEERLGRRLPVPVDDDVFGFDDHLGWHEDGGGRWFYGLNIENGRIADTESEQLKSALHAICRDVAPGVRLTAHQSILLTDIDDAGKRQVEEILRRHGVRTSESISTVRRWSMACVAWPTCGLAITESERALPGVIDQLETVLAELGLDQEIFTVRMTGCPNGCARPYNADIALVGKARDRYTVFVGGQRLGKRLNFILADLVPRDRIVPLLKPLFEHFKANREADESFGDYCHRLGYDRLAEIAQT